MAGHRDAYTRGTCIRTNPSNPYGTFLARFGSLSDLQQRATLGLFWRICSNVRYWGWGGGWGWGWGSSTQHRAPQGVSSTPTRPPITYVTPKKQNASWQLSKQLCVYVFERGLPPKNWARHPERIVDDNDAIEQRAYDINSLCTSI